MNDRAKHADWLKKLKASRGEQVEEQSDGDFPVHLAWVWEAFCALSRCRLTNQTGPQPIQMSEVASYCGLAGIETQDEIDDLLHCITELDIVWLRKTHAKIEREREKAQRKSSRR